MPFIPFKFKTVNAPTRLADFDTLPTWGDLVSKIAELFDIPRKDVGVAYYVDKYMDPITLNNEQELQRFYKSLDQSSEDIKFVVQDLRTPDAETTITSTWSMDCNPSELSKSDGDLKLFCWVIGQSGGPFSVKIRGNETVDDLKEAIKKKNEHTLAGIDAHVLDLWKLSTPILSSELSVKLGQVRNPEEIAGSVRLDPVDELSEHFLSPPRKHIHIVVQLPDDFPPPHKRPRYDRDSYSSRNTKRASPKLLATFSARKETVAALYDKINTYRFIQVRGTPASGKSTLAQLLRQHIEAVEPSTPLIWIDGWSKFIAISNTWKEHLEKDKHWDDGIASVFIFDEAQLTYEDTGLWNTLFKPISDHPLILHHRVIIFASYGSPTRINAPGTPMYIKVPQMVTLVPIDHRDGLGAVGLYLTRAEFDEFVNLRKYSFDPACLDFIFRISSGHTGAINDVINVISCDDSYRKIASSQMLFTISDFSCHFTPHRLYAGLQGASIFRRGLPDDHALQNPSVARVLRTVVRENVILDTMFPEAEESAALRQCFAQGWLHTDKGVLRNGETAGYFFASPLHWLFMEWKLFCRNPAIPIQAPNLLEFVIQIIKCFSPLNLSHPRMVGPYYFQTVPEAQYWDEFYRCCYDLTAGSLLTTLSKFGTEDGRADFYIPSKKWGFELLRDGQLFEQHHNRSPPTGQYGMALDVDEYIVLDFRTKKVVQAHPHLTYLFHVVFSEDYSNVVVIDNECRTVREFGLLQTQS